MERKGNTNNGIRIQGRGKIGGTKKKNSGKGERRMTLSDWCRVLCGAYPEQELAGAKENAGVREGE